MTSVSPRRSARNSFLLVVLALGLAACGREHARNEASGDMGPGGGRAPVPRMEARGVFFGGQLEAETLLARAGTFWARDNGSSGGDKQGGDHPGGGVGMGGGHGGVRGGGGRGGEQGGRSDDAAPQAPPIRAINEPAIQLRLRLTNHQSTTVVVQVLDFNSDLGNFVVFPEKIVVAPGESVEADPMVSRLGVESLEVPLTVRVQMDGKAEQQVLTLKVVKDAPPPPPPQK